MGDLGGNTEQPLRRERREAERPIRLAAEHVYLVVGGGTLAAIAVLTAVDHFAQVWVARGVYAIMAAVICVAGCGLVVRLEAARNRRLTCAEFAALRKAMEESAERTRTHVAKALERAYQNGFVDGAAGLPYNGENVARINMPRQDRR